MDYADLYDRTIRSREAVEAAREWLLDCDWAEGEDAHEQIVLLNAVGVIAATERHHEGGWVAFAQANGYWDGRTPRERERRCYCPGDCNCRHPHRTNFCGCKQH